MSVSERDGRRWNERYSREGAPAEDTPRLPAAFVGHEHLFPTEGFGLDVACGRGHAAVWLALQGLVVEGLDISRVAVGYARDLAERHVVGDRCRFRVADLDHGLPAGPPVDVIVCHLFRDARLDEPLVQRLRPGGLLAMAALSQADHRPEPFRATTSDLLSVSAGLNVLAAGEGGGRVWILARA